MSSWMLMYLGTEGCRMPIQWRLNCYPGTWQFGQPELCSEAYAETFGNADKCLGKRNIERSDLHKFYQNPWLWIDRITGHMQVAPLWSYVRPITTLSSGTNKSGPWILETPQAFETSLQSNHSSAAERKLVLPFISTVKDAEVMCSGDLGALLKLAPLSWIRLELFLSRCFLVRW